MAEFLNITDPVLGLLALFCLLLGLLCLLMAAVHLRRRRLLSSLTQGGLAAFLLGGAVIFLLLGINLHTYQRLTLEQPVAELAFRQIGPQRFEALVMTPAAEAPLSYRLSGDEWQLDARVLRWKAPATLAGLDARYRLERLSGRYRDINQQRERTQSVHGLARDEGLNIWALVGKLGKYVDWVDAYYGSAAYLPMADRARFEVVLTQSGLTARPLNEEAEQAVRGW